MMNLHYRGMLGALSLLAGICGGTAHAQDGDEARIKIGVTAGTLGVGPEASYRLAQNVGVRGNVTFLSVNADISSDDLDYDANLKLQSVRTAVQN
jgi:hypothetical protein